MERDGGTRAARDIGGEDSTVGVVSAAHVICCGREHAVAKYARVTGVRITRRVPPSWLMWLVAGRCRLLGHVRTSSLGCGSTGERQAVLGRGTPTRHGGETTAPIDASSDDSACQWLWQLRTAAHDAAPTLRALSVMDEAGGAVANAARAINFQPQPPTMDAHDAQAPNREPAARETSAWWESSRRGIW